MKAYKKLDAFVEACKLRGNGNTVSTYTYLDNIFENMLPELYLNLFTHVFSDFGFKKFSFGWP